MVVYALIIEGDVVVNRVISDKETAEKNNWIIDSEAQIGWERVEGKLIAPAIVDQVPQSVTMAQARLALLDQGLLADVETALNELPEPPRASALIEWEFQTIVHRDRDLVLTIMNLLGLDDTQIDNLFILAKTL